MSSAAQVIANAANAQNSTGPRSESGKATSSQNALKHGLTAKTILLPGEDEAAYRAMCAGMFEQFAPANVPEKSLLQLLCDTQWRLQRCGRIEAAILDADTLDFKAIDIISKHESRLKKQYSATLKEVQTLIDTRLTHEQAELKEAMTIRRADQTQGKTTDLKAIGFVLSTAQVDAAIARHDACTKANLTLVYAHRAHIRRGLSVNPTSTR
jgi:hypothetical protein